MHQPAQVKPSQSDIAEVLTALEERERQDERIALLAFYAMQRQKRPVLYLNWKKWVAVFLSAVAFGLAVVWVARTVTDLFFPNM